MTSKRTFTDDILKTLLSIFLFVCILMTVIWFAVGGASVSPFISLGVLGGILLSTLLIMLLVYNVTPQRRVICDSEGCEVTVSSKWGRSHTYRFAWKEVTGTRIGKTTVGSGQYRSEYVHLNVDTRSGEWELLRMNNVFRKDFAELVAIVNRMTPHLPYMWVTREEADTAKIVEEGAGSYCKVARAPERPIKVR
jgi:hypothetical protein